MKIVTRGERLHLGQDQKHSFALEHLQRYQFAARFVSQKVVLDLGCGEGYGAKMLKEAGAKKVIGIDVDREVIGQANKNYSSTKVSFQTGDAQKLTFKDKSFDLVVSLELIEHLPDYRRYLKEVRRVLKPGGVFVLSTPNKDNYRGLTSPFHTREFNLEELQKILTGLFSEVEIFGQEITNPEVFESEKRFFQLYQRLTLQSPLVKKLLLLIPPEIKAFFHQKTLGQSPPADEKDFKISKENLKEALTFLAVSRK